LSCLFRAVPLAEFPGTILGITPAKLGSTEVSQPEQLHWARGNVATERIG